MKIENIDTMQFLLVMDRFKNDSRFNKGDIIEVLENIWDTDDIKQSLTDYINDNSEKMEFQDLIEDLN